MEDNEIIRLYFTRSENAIRETDKKYGRYCHMISFNIVRNQEDAEECVSDSYLKVWDCVPPVSPLNLKAFLAKIVRNLSLNRVKNKIAKKRGNGQTQEIYDELDRTLAVGTAEDVLSGLEIAELLNGFLGTLSQEHRDIFIGRYWYFDTVADIADKMNCSQSKVKMILMKVRNALKEYLQKEGVVV